MRNYHNLYQNLIAKISNTFKNSFACVIGNACYH